MRAFRAHAWASLLMTAAVVFACSDDDSNAPTELVPSDDPSDDGAAGSAGSGPVHLFKDCDPDEDGLDTECENEAGLDPNLPDTDGDGCGDLYEYAVDGCDESDIVCTGDYSPYCVIPIDAAPERRFEIIWLPVRWTEQPSAGGAGGAAIVREDPFVITPLKLLEGDGQIDGDELVIQSSARVLFQPPWYMWFEIKADTDVRTDLIGLMDVDSGEIVGQWRVIGVYHEQFLN